MHLSIGPVESEAKNLYLITQQQKDKIKMHLALSFDVMDSQNGLGQ